MTGDTSAEDDGWEDLVGWRLWAMTPISYAREERGCVIRRQGSTWISVMHSEEAGKRWATIDAVYIVPDFESELIRPGATFVKRCIEFENHPDVLTARRVHEARFDHPPGWARPEGPFRCPPHACNFFPRPVDAADDRATGRASGRIGAGLRRIPTARPARGLGPSRCRGVPVTAGRLGRGPPTLARRRVLAMISHVAGRAFGCLTCPTKPDRRDWIFEPAAHRGRFTLRCETR